MSFRETKRRIPYGELDENVAGLCRQINRLQGVMTIGSCGGHEDPLPHQHPAGRWDVWLVITAGRRGLADLGLLAWLINVELKPTEGAYLLSPYAPDPYLNEPAQSLKFVIDGQGGATPEALAEAVGALIDRYYRGA